MKRFIFTLFIFTMSLASSAIHSDVFAEDKKLQVLMVHSSDQEPYKSLKLGMNSIIADDDPRFHFEHIYLNNRENILNRYLKNPDFQKFDVAVAAGTIALRALRDQKVLEPTFPVLFGAVTDPIDEGVITYFNEPPSGRFSGVSFSIDIKDRLREMLKIFPDVKKIGVIFSTMPQSLSYKRWLINAQKQPEFQHLEFVFRRVGTINHKDGPQQMVYEAIPHINDIKDEVDIFLSPNDQMGINPNFAQTVLKLSSKPVFGVWRDEVLTDDGAVASAYPKISDTGKALAKYLIALSDGEKFENLYPVRPTYEVIVNQRTLKQFK